tara:strand:+ start:46330 stop:46863 length:534 start_codon:yes stop_codon:yes gene_type:complete
MLMIENALSQVTAYFMLPVLILLALMFCYSLFALGGFLYDIAGRKFFARYPTSIARLIALNHNIAIETLELQVLKELEMLRIVSRVAPMLGLVATMIPMGPALIAVSQGDSLGMAQQLEVAFSAVITALMAASITFVVLLVKRRWLLAEISDYNQGLVQKAGIATVRESELRAEASA